MLYFFSIFHSILGKIILYLVKILKFTFLNLEVSLFFSIFFFFSLCSNFNVSFSILSFLLALL